MDQLSGGRLVLGVASGDRPVEFPAFGVEYERRDHLFRESLRVIREVFAEEFPKVRSSYGTLSGTADLVPKPIGRLPILVTGSSRQSSGMDRRAFRRLDHLPAVPRTPGGGRRALACRRVGRGTGRVQAVRPVVLRRPDRRSGPTAEPIHLGIRGGRNVVFRFLDELRAVGVHHVILNFKYGTREAAEVLDEIGREILPQLEASQPATAVSHAV